ncbi:MAG: UDP-2,4-diacetamido-2,4,6-trideoxy-beta-L-altropyranose hydrolase [Aeromonas sp.]
MRAAPLIALRCDAGSELGLGHLMRSLALADTLAARGAECVFLCYQLPAELRARVAPHRLIALSSLTDSAPLAALAPAALVVDHYQLDARWETAARAQCGRLLVIDDLADRPHCADILLDQGPRRRAQEYAPLLSPQVPCQLLLGTRYALLRSEFRALAATRPTRPPADWKRGLICFGGADPTGACLSALTSLAQTPWLTRLHWTLVAGNANRHWPTIATWVADWQAAHPEAPLTLLPATEQMAALLVQQDVTLGAAGGMTWERACLGVPTVVVPIVDHQAIYADLIAEERLGEVLSLAALAEPAAVDAALTRLAADASGVSARSQALVDGLGLERVADALLAVLAPPPINTGSI